MDVNLGVIPEVFYDLIGRVLPGILIIFCTVMVVFGPVKSIYLLINGSFGISAWLTLLVIVVSYFIAIVLTNIWDFFGRRFAEEHIIYDQKNFTDILKSVPGLASRLIKIQAEKNMCKAMITGLIILSIISLWIWGFKPPIGLNDRFWLIIGFLVSIFSFIEWLRQLDTHYNNALTSFNQANSGTE